MLIVIVRVKKFVDSEALMFEEWAQLFSLLMPTVVTSSAAEH